MKRWLGVAVVAALSLLALGIVASGQDSGPMPHPGWPAEHMEGPMAHLGGLRMRTGGPEGFGFERGHEMGQRLLAMLDNDRVKAYLNLTEPQAQKLRQIVVDAEKSGVQTGAQLAVRGIELRELLRADLPDRDAVMKKVEELSSLRGQMMKQHVQALLDAESVLTPEQRKKVRQFIETRHAFGGRAERFEERGFRTRPHDGPGMPPAPTPRPGEPPVN